MNCIPVFTEMSDLTLKLPPSKVQVLLEGPGGEGRRVDILHLLSIMQYVGISFSFYAFFNTPP